MDDHPAPRRSTSTPQPMRPILLGVACILLVQFLLGMVVNLFVVVPASHPGAGASNYFPGVVAVIAWSVTRSWPWIALHVGLGVGLVVGGLVVLVWAWSARQTSVLIACSLSVLAAAGAAFNGASFLMYGHDFSSMIMAGGFALSVGFYVLALFLARQRP